MTEKHVILATAIQIMCASCLVSNVIPVIGTWLLSASWLSLIIFSVLSFQMYSAMSSPAMSSHLHFLLKFELYYSCSHFSYASLFISSDLWWFSLFFMTLHDCYYSCLFFMTLYEFSHLPFFRYLVVILIRLC